MKTIITKGLEPEYVLEIKGAFKASLPVRKRLQDILESKVQEHFKAQYAKDNYDSPSWSQQQADSMGYVRALREVISLLDDKTKEVIAPAKVGRPRKDMLKPTPLVGF